MAVTQYLWNDITDTVAMEKDGAGNTTAVYASDPVPFGRLRSMRRGGNTYNYHYDGRGNTTYLTDQTGRKTDAYTYGPFGTPRTATGSTENPYRFGGQHGYQYNESTGDYYVRARVYQPKRGRWRSKDPLRFVDGMNLYVFVGNGPLNRIDPTGLQQARLECFRKARSQRYESGEFGVIGGAGLSSVYCIDQSGCCHEMFFWKVCGGYIFGGGATWGKHNLKGARCHPCCYQKWFAEAGVSAAFVAQGGIDVGIESPLKPIYTGTSERGGGVAIPSPVKAPSFKTCQVKVGLCYYTFFGASTWCPPPKQEKEVAIGDVSPAQLMREIRRQAYRNCRSRCRQEVFDELIARKALQNN